MSKCLCCDRLADIMGGKNPLHVAHLQGGELVLADDFLTSNKYIFIFGRHEERLSDLNSDERREMIRALCQIDEFIRNEGQPPITVHFELLGDSVPHLHWHITPIFEPTKVEQYAENHARFWNRYWDAKE